MRLKFVKQECSRNVLKIVSKFSNRARWKRIWICPLGTDLFSKWNSPAVQPTFFINWSMRIGWIKWEMEVRLHQTVERRRVPCRGEILLGSPLHPLVPQSRLCRHVQQQNDWSHNRKSGDRRHRTRRLWDLLEIPLHRDVGAFFFGQRRSSFSPCG